MSGQLVVPQGKTEVIDVSPQRFAQVRVEQGDLVLLDDTTLTAGGRRDYLHLERVSAVVVTAMGADALISFGSAA